MKELSMHVYDLMENSTAANSSLVELTIKDSLKDNIYAFTIKDNGKGMTPEFLAKVTDPWTTSRTTRKVGLGLPLIKMNTENCGGGMKIERPTKTSISSTSTSPTTASLSSTPTKSRKPWTGCP